MGIRGCFFAGLVSPRSSHLRRGGAATVAEVAVVVMVVFATAIAELLLQEPLSPRPGDDGEHDDEDDNDHDDDDDDTDRRRRRQ